uniref:UBX domain-containing protein 1 n=1 Tax=Magallana gigas TaxID=29159 RepID=K1QYD0_MAGGI
MGFSFEDGQEAVQNGHLSVERAVEWILAGKPGQTSSADGPRLQLRAAQPTLENDSNPFVNPPVPLTTVPDSASRSTNQNTAAVATDQSKPSKSHRSDSDDNQSETVISRLHLSDKQKCVRDDFEAKRRKEARDDALKEKQRRKRDHERVLKEIAEDREKKKMTNQTPETVTKDTQGPVAGPSAGSHPKQTPDRCQLQIRLLRGDVVKQSYPASEPFRTVWESVTKLCHSSDIVLIQPFPHREFTAGDSKSSLLDLQLTPSASLMVKRKDVPPTHGQDVEDMVEDDDSDREEEEGHPFHQGMPPGFPPGFGGLGGLGGLPMMPGMQLGGAGMNQNQAFEGVGQRLGYPHDEDAHHNVPAAQLAAEKARERFARPAPVPERQEVQLPVTLTYDVNSLTQLCMNHIAQRLTQHDPRHPLLSLSGISEDVAQKILTYLLKEKLLKPKVLNTFIPCFLRKLILDCYPYATNELLHAVRYHCQIQTLSLNSCSLITDAGLLELTSLKKLKHLNLSGCRQLTDKCLEIVKEMPGLVSLNLDGTGVTESGFIGIILSLPASLQVLNLNRMNITEKLLTHLKDLENLKVLCLEHTKICGLSGVEQLKSLETLDVSQTDIVSESLLCLGDNLTCLGIANTERVNGDLALQYIQNNLTCLGIANTERVNGDLALQYIQRLSLRSLSLPSRLTTTDTGLQFISHMPLTELDLTNFINIFKMYPRLRKLLLSNTKITDAGMNKLKDLKDLQILYLDRTLVTDACSEVIKCFQGLVELSLASTGITSQFLCNGALDSCHDLSKLNLCRTLVSNRGVSSLRSDSFTLINLDGTRVKPDIVETLQTQCPNLRKVTTANIIPVNSDDEG